MKTWTEEDGWIVQEIEHLPLDATTTRVCTRCGKLKSEESFVRKLTNNQALSKARKENLHTTTAELYERAAILRKSTHTIHKMCNACAERHRVSVAKGRSKPESAVEYEKRIRLRGRHEYMIPDPDKPNDPNATITARELLVRQHKEALASHRYAAVLANKVKEYKRTYSAYMKDVSNEILRINAMLKSAWVSGDDAAREFMLEYIEHLKALRDTLREERFAKTPTPPLSNPFKYINYDSLVTKNALSLMENVSDYSLFTRINPHLIPTADLVKKRAT